MNDIHRSRVIPPPPTPPPRQRTRVAPVFPNDPFHHHPGNIWTCPFPNARAPFAATPSCPPPPRATPRTSPQPSQAAPCPSALSASAGTSTLCPSFSVQQSEPGMINSTLSSNVSTMHFGSKTPASSYAACGSVKTDATKNTTTCMRAQVVEDSHTALARALERRRQQPQTPYRADAWKLELERTGLIDRFPSIPAGLRHGFIVGYPALSSVQTPPNSTSLAVYEPEFRDIVNKELAKGRYIGPFPVSKIEASLGPFQTSPLSLIPKPRKPGKFRLIQNFSFPIEVSPRFPNPSINQAVTEEFFPCTWGKFSIIYLLILHLPAGSQVATCDVVEAYQTIPLHESQWPAAVVRTSNPTACIDTCVVFGASPSCGAYGQMVDAGTEILRANGIGLLDKWVDDHIFFCIL